MKPIEEIEKALEQSVTPAGKLSAVLVVAKTHAAELAALRARVGELEQENKFLGAFYQAVRDIQDDEDLPKAYAYDKIQIARYDFEDGLAAALAKGAK